MSTEKELNGNIRGRRSRKEILDVAVRLMAEKGYAATSVSTLCQETGLPKSAIYHHFQSKSGLLSAVMEHNANLFFNEMKQAHMNPPKEGEPLELLNWYLQSTGTVFLAHTDFLKLHLILVMSAEAPEISEMITKVRYNGRMYMKYMILSSFNQQTMTMSEMMADKLSYFAIAGFDGIVVEKQANAAYSFESALALLAESLALLGKKYAH
jgi:AcrR family transcriptional regulator